jgi:HSP20 family molecular chaperone IbpA
MQVESIQQSKPVKVIPIREPAEYRKRLHDLIERCAYEFYESRGCVEGHALEDWQEAEVQVLCSDVHCPVGFIDLDAVLDVEASVGDFRAEDLEVDVEPLCLTIGGDHHPRPTDKPHPVFRVLHLPVEIDPSKVTASLEGWMLHVVLPKKARSEKHRQGTKAA